MAASRWAGVHSGGVDGKIRLIQPLIEDLSSVVGTEYSDERTWAQFTIAFETSFRGWVHA